RQREQRRSARPERDPLRVHEPDRKQRQRVCRPDRQHAVVRAGRGAVHVVRPIPLHHPVAGHRRQPGRQKDGADLGRYAADARPAVRRPADRDSHRRRCVDLLSGAIARSHRGALPDAPGQARGGGRHLVPDLELTHMASPARANFPPPAPAPPAPSPVDESSLIPKKLVRARPLFDPEILRRALKDSVLKLNPVTLMKNPVIFVVEVGAALVLLFLVRDIVMGRGGIGFELQIDLWLWFTVLFATFAEAMAEARGKAQAESLRKTKTDTIANKLLDGGRIEKISSSKHRAGDVVV